jgi:hypothetical protein
MITQNQQFDTIRLHIPEEAISKLDRSVFSIPSSKNAHTYEDDYKGVEQLWLNDIGQGINYVKYIPQLKFYDVRISAKILREKYWQGIQEDNIEDVIDKLENRMQCEIDYSQFIEQGKIIQCDNTFNLKLDLGTTKNIADYLEALDLLVVQGSKYKLDVYNDKGDKYKINSVVVGKNTNFQQKITFYNKLEEANALCSKMKGIYGENVEKEYGMKYDDFHNYFNDKIRCELKVSKWQQLRKFYTNKSKGEVYLQEILKSKNNAIEYQWEQFVNKKETKIGLTAIDEMYMIKKAYTEDFVKGGIYKQILPMMKAYNGNATKVKEQVKKLWYANKKSGKISPSVANTIVELCAAYKQNELRNKNGVMFVNRLGDNFKELEKQIKKI